MCKQSKVKSIIAALVAGILIATCVPVVGAAPAPSLSAGVEQSELSIFRTPFLGFSLWANVMEQEDNRGFGRNMRINYDQTVEKVADGVYEYTDELGAVHVFRYNEATDTILDDRGWKLIDYGDDLYWIRPYDKREIYFENGRLHHIYISQVDVYTGYIPNIYVDYNEQGLISSVRYVIRGDTTYETMDLSYTVLDNGMTVCTRVGVNENNAVELLYNDAGDLVGVR